MKNLIKVVVAILIVSAFAVTACASAFVPSVEQKEAPVVVADAEGNVADVVIAPAATEDASEEAQAAYAALVELGSAEAVAPELAGKVITDVFEVTASEEVEAKLAAGEEIKVAFEVEVEEGQTITVLYFNGEEWVVVPAEFVTFENGVLTVTMTQTGVYAFVVG